MSVKIAKANPFGGKPVITMPSVYGVTTGKEAMYRIPVLGERPVKVQVKGLPEGLVFENGTIRGVVPADGEFTITVTAEDWNVTQSFIFATVLTVWLKLSWAVIS